jgi:hypothetical protein
MGDDCPMTLSGSWTIRTVDDADVRLRSGRIGLFSVDVKAPVRSGSLRIAASGVELNLVLALEKLSTGNFLMDGAARGLVTKHNAHDLTYSATGTDGQPWRVSGLAVSGDVRVQLAVTITPSDSSMQHIELQGGASMGQVHLPLPGVGTVDDFNFEVDAHLKLDPA